MANGCGTDGGVWFEINRDTPVPHGLRQLQRLLELRAPEDYAAAILSIDRAIALDGPPLPRTNPDSDFWQWRPSPQGRRISDPMGGMSQGIHRPARSSGHRTGP
jgi:hypothetical protein